MVMMMTMTMMVVVMMMTIIIIIIIIMKFRVSLLCKKVIPPYSGRFWTLQSPCRRPFTIECSAVNLSLINFSFTSCMLRLSVTVVSFRHNFGVERVNIVGC